LRATPCDAGIALYVEIKRNIVIPAGDRGRSPLQNRFVFIIHYNNKLAFGAHPTEGALHATPLQSRISITPAKKPIYRQRPVF